MDNCKLAIQRGSTLCIVINFTCRKIAGYDVALSEDVVFAER